MNKITRGILVTGCAGFIGFHLSKRLLEEGIQVLGLDNINDYYDTTLKSDRLTILKKYPNFHFVKSEQDQKDKKDKKEQEMQGGY
ncbi:GDP-mannose 4,6-dehydratase [Bacillus sp. FJAT-49732]|uniref:GDP-mannose 4,6-dehydratase n=1 Tax=Lederbergia citrisecunda TaxID=2833583 RepID=A0A942TQT2_9BACI|nr:GDP-mannose 4,6-dehydratase [Lederbergia citrisecunda]